MKGKTPLLVLLTSFILYIMDIISDFYVAVQYYKNGEVWWCAITLVFVIVPHVIINTYAAYINVNFLWLSPQKAFLLWIFQVSILASFKQEFARWKREHWKNSGNTRDGQHSADLTLTMHHTFLCLAEAFAESAPQCCLQNYIMIRQWHFPWYTVLSTVLSLLSLAWSITSLETSCKICQCVENQQNKTITKRSLLVFVAAHLCLLISRLTSLVIFAYVFRCHVFIIVGTHWLLVFVGICLGKKFDPSTRIISITKNGNKTDIKDRIRLTLILNASLRAYPMVFCFSSSIAKLSFRKKISKNYKAFVFIFYGIFCLENAVMVLISIFSELREAGHITILTKIALPLVFGGFLVGVAFLFLYYSCCHPGKISTRENVIPGTSNSTGLLTAESVQNDGIVQMNHAKYFVNEGTCYEDEEHEI